MTAAVERIAAGELRVTGRIDFDNANEVVEQGTRLIAAETSDVRVDLAGLTAGGSVAVAVLLAWFRQAAMLDLSIRFANVPPELVNVIEFSGLDDVVMIEAG